MMLLYILYVTLSVVFVSGKECDKLGILIYEDLGCTPEYGDNKDCPIKYSCKGLEPSDKNCHFRGKIYQYGEQVEAELSDPSCDQSCVCSTQVEKGGFDCAILDCPEWLGVPVKFGCYRNFTLEHCCSVGQICPPFDNLEKCAVEGKEYGEGQKFSPSNTCLECVCKKGFKGKFEEPFCRRTTCGQQLRRTGVSIQNSCAPFYNKARDEILCCPEHWICPDGSETIKGDAKSDEVCKIGKKTVKVGQYFEKVDVKDDYGRSFKKIRCECVIPPLMKCIKV